MRIQISKKKPVFGVNFSLFNRNDVKFTFLDKYTSYFIKFVILTLDRSGLWLVRLGNYIEFSRATLKSGRIPTSTIRQPIHVTKTFLNTNLPKILEQIRKILKRLWALTPWLRGFEILNNATLIFQNGLFLGIFQISFIILIFLKNMYENFRNFSWQFVIKIFVKIIIWLWT